MKQKDCWICMRGWRDENMKATTDDTSHWCLYVTIITNEEENSLLFVYLQRDVHDAGLKL